jgi:hypothetical protein
LTDAIHQRPQDLILGIVQTELSYPVKPLQSAVYDAGLFRLQFQIIGESHIVRVECAGAPVFHEVLACLPLRAEQCAHWHRFADLRPHTYQAGRYCVEVQCDSTPDGWSPPAQPQQQLEVHFPLVNGQTPVTRVAWAQIDTTTYWWTLHTYPAINDTVYVYTASYLDGSE